MIVYSGTKLEFTQDVYGNVIEEKILARLKARAGHAVGASEVQSWQNSMQYMNNALVGAGIPDDAGVAVEYKIPLTSKRVDFILSGLDEAQQETVIIVELKQWTTVEPTIKDAVVETFVAGGKRDVLQGNKEFQLVDDQKLVFEKALELADRARIGKKQVLIVEGGPGTGKSVVAINLLVEFTQREHLAHYVTRNAAPRAVYESKLTGSFSKSHITNLFKGSGAYTDAPRNSMDVLVVDEAHRLNERSGL